MRISFFVPRCTPENSHGRYVIELATRFSAQHRVRVYAGAFWSPLRSVFDCHFLPVPNRPAIARLGALWVASAVAARIRPSDIIHIQGADAPIGNVLTAHYCNQTMRAVTNHRASLYRRFNYAIGAAAERYCMSRTDTRWVIAVSHQVKSEIEREYRVDPQKVVVIHHGVDAKAFDPRGRAALRDPVRRRWNFQPGDFVVLFVGGDYRRKGLLPLLEAASRVQASIKVLAVGAIPDAALKQRIQSEGLEDLVSFPGMASEMAPYYAAADCFALPTRYDTFSLATLEAMASGLSVIVSRAAGVSEILTPNRDCLLLEDPSDVDMLTQYLEQLMGSDQLRRSLEMEGRNTAERYSWDVVAARTLEVYHRIISTPT
jgi:UDP-glucose:(heptosyl)LPS alpha-1,3-glucosyltransferase